MIPGALFVPDLAENRPFALAFSYILTDYLRRIRRNFSVNAIAKRNLV